MPDQDETIDLLGSSLHINSRQEVGYHRAAASQSATIVFRDEVPALLRIACLLGPKTTFVDCGANVGLFSSTFAPLLQIYPNFNIVAIEPHPITFQRLQHNLHSTRAHLFNVALSDRNGTLTVAPGAVSGVFGVPKSPYQINSEQLQIPCVRLDQLPIDGNELFLKVDVEGHEFEVLLGAGPLFEDRRISGVFIDGADRFPEIIHYLEERDMHLLNLRNLTNDYLSESRILAIRRQD